MKKNMGLAVLGFFTIIALIGAIVGPFLMLAAAIQKYGWIALLADGKLSAVFLQSSPCGRCPYTE